MGVAATVAVDNHLDTLGERFLLDTSLVGPRAVEMAEPYLATTDGEHAGGKLRQGDGVLLAIGDVGPRLYHINIGTRLVIDTDGGGVLGVAEREGGEVTLLTDSGEVELGGHVAVGMAQGDGSGRLGPHAIGGIDVETTIGRSGQGGELGGTEPGAEIDVLGLVAFVGIDD